jgi:hypothetical protein
MTDYNINDINVNLQYQNNNLNKTLMDTRVLVNSLDNEIQKLKLENNRLKEQVHKLTIIKEKYEPSPSPSPSPRGFEQALSSKPSEPLPSTDTKLIKNIEIQTQSDKKESYFNILSYFRK